MRTILYSALAIIALSSCAKDQKRISPTICLNPSSQIESLEIQQEQLDFFAANMMYMDRGQFLSGAFKMNGASIYTSVYEGPKVDSLVTSLAPSGTEKIGFPNNHYGWQSKELLYIYNEFSLVQISFPSEIKSNIVPINGVSNFFSLCD